MRRSEVVAFKKRLQLDGETDGDDRLVAATVTLPEGRVDGGFSRAVEVKQVGVEACRVVIRKPDVYGGRAVPEIAVLRCRAV